MSEETEAFCPSCGDNSIEEDVCSSCGFSLGTILTCPYQNNNNTCQKTRANCNIKNMDWEVCLLEEDQ